MQTGTCEFYPVPILIFSGNDRWKHFGQNDHVRMYSKTGFITKLQSVGFTVHQLDISYFGANVFERNGIHPRSILYIVCK